MKGFFILGCLLLLQTVAFTIFDDRWDDIWSRVTSFPRNRHQSIDRKVGTDDFEHIESVYDEDYKLRIRAVDPLKLNIDTVKQWSGYLDYKKSKLFFYWYFESRNDPVNDPVILWLNGGPGCSSFTGLLFELGPSSLGPDLKPIHNPYSWNNNASVIFLEQPLGVGFSYGDSKVSSTHAAGKDVYIFLELFFNKFPELRKNGFHIAGESYAGHYIPQIAHEIVFKNPKRTFNLSSILIGNGITDSLVQTPQYAPMACGKGGYPQVLSDEECIKMESHIKRCTFLINSCYRTQSSFPCVSAASYCDSVVLNPYSKTGLNVYDIRGPCEDNSNDGLCYNGLRYVEQFMNKKWVQRLLGSDVSEYKGCNDQVFLRFFLTGDGAKPFQQFVAELVNAGIPTLAYAGDKDYICNWLGNKAWTDALEWAGKERYDYLPLKPWLSTSSNKEFGQVKSYGPLTFLRVYDAGHMVPYDQPEAALELVNSWIHGNQSFGYKG
ncbi:hypothetical protein Kpol_1036p14 [Vanderwaltozyma polyspora DSM 70294]|uniref:Carboxypeptidase n=1 Tax=Vanderwaltozyma polyspora (strain ATCC 22028 / DSM 70294 / BCRC 21397 / CBS 2163 / NBRC 10782 / NRRL Y-8283 / UCD 57-17) TaxID=436907 RepID=A7TEG5_VANPO|nr:uncharacterized protein Kpol_1036p14 [Vanderwaltozyma polyspora DSM 70294]EDO19272.1 hypothetical protein Kpol_1036p14 [Vanderwaltozyma polyspora DSM 70294]